MMSLYHRDMPLQQIADLVHQTKGHKMVSSILNSPKELSKARGEFPVLPPARPLIPVASGGPLGLGCEGDLRFSAGRCILGCSLGPRLSRVGFPGGGGEAAAAQPWNKSLRPCLRFAGVRFRAGERPVREGSL